MFGYVCMFVRVCVCLRVVAYVSVRLCSFVIVCACLRLFALVCVCLCMLRMFAYVCVCSCLFAFVCVWLRIRVYLRVSSFMFAYA